MRELCIDTSYGTAIAVVSGGEVVGRAFEANPRLHAERLIPLINEAAVGNTVWDRILVGTGPAPFTGLRAGLITARVLARASGVPLVGAPSLAALAASSLTSSTPLVTAVSDARRGEVYWASYSLRDGEIVEVQQPQVGKNPTILGQQIGPGIDVDPARLVDVVDSRLRQGLDCGTEPLYLRSPDIHGHKN